MKKVFLSFLFAALLHQPLLTIAQSENSVGFDNIDDHIIVPGASAGIAGGNQITLMCWVKPKNTNIVFPDYDGIAGIRNNTDADFYFIHFTPTGIEARFRNSAGVNYDIVDNSLQIGVWQHYALRYNGSELTLFKDGVQVSTVIASGQISNISEALYIGGMPYQTFNFYMNGDIDEVSLWNRALSPGEINCFRNFGVPAGSLGLVNYYKCNQGVAGGINVNQTALYDQTGNIDGNFINFALSGPTSNFVTGVSTVTDIADSYCSGGSYTFGTQVLNTPGVYTEVFNTLLGCDSVVRLTLTEFVLNTTVVSSNETLTALAPGLSYQWIDCQNGNQPVPGAISQSFTPAVNGDYAVVVSNGVCSDTSACYSISVGIPEAGTLPGVIVYPNPAKEFLMIRTDGLHEADVVVRDITGRVVLTQPLTGNECRIHTADWTSGVYTVEVIAGERRSVHRINR